MKIKIGIVTIVVIILVVAGLRVSVTMSRGDDHEQESVTPVKVSRVEKSTMEDVLPYEGRITPLSVERISFKSTARLALVGGEVGETVPAGTILASLELSDLQLAKEAAENQLLGAKANYNLIKQGTRSEDITLASLNVEKALDGLEYIEAKYEDILALLEEGVVSESEVDELKLNLDIASSDYELAKTNYEKAINGAQGEQIEAAQSQVAVATTNLEVQKVMIEDATYTLDEPKVIVEKMYEPGELVPAGYPVVVIRSVDQSVVIGVTRKDLDKINLNQKVHVEINDKAVEAQVSRIAQVPDESHFLYEVEIRLPKDDYIVGEIVNCRLVVGQREVVKIPITAIMNDGIDYIYVANEGKASIKQIDIIDMVDGYAIVEGLEPGTEMIISNLNRISENSRIEVEE